jgi:thioredoxin reductase (NADPH)
MSCHSNGCSLQPSAPLKFGAILSLLRAGRTQSRGSAHFRLACPMSGRDQPLALQAGCDLSGCAHERHCYFVRTAAPYRRRKRSAMGDKPSIVATQGQELFPVFTESELHRLRRFGIVHHYLAGATVVAAGEPTDGLLFVLSGTVAVTRRGVSGDTQQTATYGPGAFVGELADLSGRSSLVTAKALDPLSALVVSAEGLAALWVTQSEVCERILRALILRHLGLVQVRCPIIIGSRLSRDVLRLESFLRQNRCPQQTLDPGGDETARTLIGRFKVGDSALPIVLCPNGRLLCNPTASELALAVGIGGTASPDRN